MARPKSTVFALVKLLDAEEHADALIEGHIRMNSLKFFREYSDTRGELRGDSWETTTAVYQPDRITVDFAGLTILSEDMCGPLTIQSNDLGCRKAFCLYSMNDSGIDISSPAAVEELLKFGRIHEQNYGLGKYCVVITNVTEFVSRVERAFHDRSELRSFSRGLVKYFDETTYHGSFLPEEWGYMKRQRFALQREYRIVVASKEPESLPIVLDIGPIDDITIKTRSDTFNAGLRVTVSGKSAGASDDKR